MTEKEKDKTPVTREDLDRLEQLINNYNKEIAQELNTPQIDIDLTKKKIKSLPDKLKAVVLRKINDSYIKIGEKRIKSTDTSFRFLHGEKGATFIIPKDIKIVYSDGKWSYIFYDFDSGLLEFDKTDFPISIEETDDLVSKNVIAGLFAKIKGSLEKPEIGSAILKYIVVAIAFGAIGWIAHDATSPQIPTQMIFGRLLSWLM